MTTTTWLLGRAAPDDFIYGAHRMAQAGDGRWCVRHADAEVTVCGRAIASNKPEAVEVFTTCAGCGSTMAATGQALALPMTVAMDASRSYWRYRNDAARANAQLLRREATT